MSQYASQILSTPGFKGVFNYIVFANVSKDGDINFISTNRSNFMTCVKELSGYTFTLSDEWDNITVIGQSLGSSYNITLVDKITRKSFKIIIKTTSNKLSECDFNLIIYLWKTDKPTTYTNDDDEEESNDED